MQNNNLWYYWLGLLKLFIADYFIYQRHFVWFISKHCYGKILIYSYGNYNIYFFIIVQGYIYCHILEEREGGGAVTHK